MCQLSHKDEIVLTYESDKDEIVLTYESDNVAEKLLGDWEGLCKLFEIAVKVEETMEGIET